MPNGNKKFYVACKEVKDMTIEFQIFYSFLINISINISGQFISVIKIFGPIDFNKIIN